MKPLTHRQERFCHALVHWANGAEAAREAGDTVGSARKQASVMLYTARIRKPRKKRSCNAPHPQIKVAVPQNVDICRRNVDRCRRMLTFADNYFEIFHNTGQTESGRHLIRRHDHQLQRNRNRVIVPCVPKKGFRGRRRGGLGWGAGTLQKNKSAVSQGAGVTPVRGCRLGVLR